MSGGKTKFITFLILILLFRIKLHLCIKDTLELVHVIFRHGSRTPVVDELYPKDPYKERFFYPYGYGELTIKGKQDAYKLGTILNKRYTRFLGETFENGCVEAYSTDHGRTKSSALLVLAGLYPPSAHEIWQDNVLWQPIPYNYIRFEKDYWLRRANFFCPKYQQEIDKVVKQSQHILDEHKKELEYVTNCTGKLHTTFLDVLFLHQVLHAERTMNLTLPEWTRNIYPSLTSALGSKQFYLESSNTLLKRLGGGRLMSKILKHIQNKISDTLRPSNRKMFLYSGHDTSITTTLSVLGLFKEHFPNYAAAVLIELHRLPDKGYYVKILYSRDVNKPTEELTIEGCSLMCPINSFFQIIKPYVSDNYTSDCQATVNLDEFQI